MGENAVLTRFAAPAMVEAQAQSEASGQTEHVYTEARYAARTWQRERRVVIKAEVVRLEGRVPRDNARFVITNLRQTPRFVYEHVYCARGDIVVSSQGHINQSVQVRPRLPDSGLVAGRRRGAQARRRSPPTNMRERRMATHQVATYSERRRSLVTREFRWPRRSITREGSKS